MPLDVSSCPQVAVIVPQIHPAVKTPPSPPAICDLITLARRF
jgi:hypothetical protein